VTGRRASALRPALEVIERRLEAGERAEALLAFVAGRRVALPEEELSSARRRAMLVLAAGGDPHRELEPDARAVLVLARELDSPERREALQAGLAALRAETLGLPHASQLLDDLEAEPDLAWRSFAWSLLVEELE
jgi:hypothetical protein